MLEIRLGLEIGLDVREDAKLEIDARQMRITRLRLWRSHMWNFNCNFLSTQLGAYFLFYRSIKIIKN